MRRVVMSLGRPHSLGGMPEWFIFGPSSALADPAVLRLGSGLQAEQHTRALTFITCRHEFVVETG
jgi:hypothetical protein